MLILEKIYYHYNCYKRVTMQIQDDVLRESAHIAGKTSWENTLGTLRSNKLYAFRIQFVV